MWHSDHINFQTQPCSFSFTTVGHLLVTVMTVSQATDVSDALMYLFPIYSTGASNHSFLGNAVNVS